jgi:hypothetical protein
MLRCSFSLLPLVPQLSAPLWATITRSAKLDLRQSPSSSNPLIVSYFFIIHRVASLRDQSKIPIHGNALSSPVYLWVLRSFANNVSLVATGSSKVSFVPFAETGHWFTDKVKDTRVKDMSTSGNRRLAAIGPENTQQLNLLFGPLSVVVAFRFRLFRCEHKVHQSPR